MDLENAKNRIHSYIKTKRSWPLIVDFQTVKDLNDFIDYFQVGDNHFPTIEYLCNNDSILKIEELFHSITNDSGITFLTHITGFLKLVGEENTRETLKSLVSTTIYGNVVVFTYQCKNYLKMSDPRINEMGRIIIVDGVPDPSPAICFIDPSISTAFPGAYQGINKIGELIENGLQEKAYISTKASKEDFPKSIFQISVLNNSYDLLCTKDSRTDVVPESFGTISHWNYALSLMGKNGNWDTIVNQMFGSDTALANGIVSYESFDNNRKWLYFILLSIFGAKNNDYLQIAINSSETPLSLPKAIIYSLLSVSKNDTMFTLLYSQRKELLKYFQNYYSEFIEYCKQLSIKGKEAVFYLTDTTQIEKERVIQWLDTYGEQYQYDELSKILSTPFPALSAYLTKYRFKSKLLDHYVNLYKYQKIVNRILPSFESMVYEQATKLDYVTELKPRTSIVDKIDTQESCAYFIDALGVEYLGYIQEKCGELGLSANIECGRCQLPSITICNKDFMDTFYEKKCPVVDIKDLDEIKHHGKDNYDYEKVKTPLYLIRELEIIDEVLKKIRSSVLNGIYKKAIIVSDHGASRLAVLHNTENLWSMATSGEHSGRCCKISEIDSKPDYAVSESGYWVLANYDRFKGSRKANVEVHGGASIEEVAVPIIEITQKQTGIKAFIIDSSKVICLSAKEYVVLKVYVGVKSNNISVRLNGHFYDAKQTVDDYVYEIELSDIRKKGIYTIDIMNGQDVLSKDEQFEVKKKGLSEVDLFG